MFPRMLSYYISWHMKQALAPILFYDNDKPGAAAKRADPVAAAQRSDQALTKAARKRTQDGVAVHSFTSLLADLATICANHIQPADDTPAFTMITAAWTVPIRTVCECILCARGRRSGPKLAGRRLVVDRALGACTPHPVPCPPHPTTTSEEVSRHGE